jgi:serine/threonine protein kinase
MVLVFELAGLDLVEYSRQFGEANRRMFNTEEVRVLSYQVAMALVEMHNGKYMHRDLKPENILIDPQTRKRLL